jgi:peptidoglycan hydrolase-like protein with peptidoglycan-binding domain
VAPGDTLIRIASRFGTTTANIMSLNGITNPNLIRVGRVLTISGTAPAATPTPVTAAPAPTSSRPAFSVALRRGSTGEAVRYLQSALGLRVDGWFGPVTDRAVRAFQAANRLRVDGIVGSITWSKLP